MPFIPAQPVRPGRDTLSIRLDRDLHEQLKAYAEFVGGSRDYVIAEVLRRVLRHDKDFAAWLPTRARPSIEPQARGAAEADRPTGDGVTSATSAMTPARPSPVAHAKR